MNYTSCVKASHGESAEPKLGSFGCFFGQKLQRDKSVEGYVLSFVDYAHAASTGFRDEAVMRDGLPDHWREFYVSKTGKSIKAMELALAQEDG